MKKMIFTYPWSARTLISMNFLLVFLMFHNISVQASSSEPDTLLPVQIIAPEEIQIDELVNFSLQQARPVGDINADGTGDFVINASASNTFTDDPGDRINKSLIITDISNPGEGQIFYGGRLSGIGDYNGDGFDDVLDIQQQFIRFGSTTGLSDDTIQLQYPDSFDNEVLFAGDFSGDGKSDFILDDSSDLNFFVFSISLTTPIELEWIGHNPDFSFNVFDYDADSVNELCISKSSGGSNERLLLFYTIDSLSNQMVLEYDASLYTNYEPHDVFPHGFGDFNGDNLPDMYDSFNEDGYFHFALFFGKVSQPYFQNMMLFDSINKAPQVYFAGDFNHDGSDDLYCKIHPDTLLMYYGNTNIEDQGFIREKIFLGHDRLLHPHMPGSYVDEYFPQLYYNNDTIPDLLFDYWSFDENRNFVSIGTAIVPGGETPDFENPILMTNPAEESFQELQYGYRTKKIGDLNQDGFEDWATIAAKGAYADIFYGGSAPYTRPDIRIKLPQNVYSYTFDIAAGDLNGDGWTDLAVSNSSYQEYIFVDEMIETTNEVLIYFGGPNWPSEMHIEDADVVLTDTNTFYEFGKNLEIVGDYNGDGIDDLVIGGGKHMHCLREAFVYFGGESIENEPDITISVPCTQCGIEFAEPISKCGDLNGDGFQDFAMGDPENENGQVLVYFGGVEADSLFDLAIVNPEPEAYDFGKYINRNAGDFDHDGFNDIAIAGGYQDPNVYIYKGGYSMNSQPDYIFPNSQTGYFSFVEFANDFTLEGKADLFIGNDQTGDVFGFTDVEPYNTEAEYILHNDWGGVRSLISGDFNNDGYSELIAGIPTEPNYGSEYGGVIRVYQNQELVGLGEANSVTNNQFVIYPNPVHDIVYMKLPEGVSFEEVEFEIHDMTGRLILGPETISFSGSIQLQGVQKGAYLLKCTYNGMTETRRVIVY
jgi:hypothetical protein